MGGVGYSCEGIDRDDPERYNRLEIAPRRGATSAWGVTPKKEHLIYEL